MVKIAYVDPGRPERVQYFIKDVPDFIVQPSSTNPRLGPVKKRKRVGRLKLRRGGRRGRSSRNKVDTSFFKKFDELPEDSDFVIEEVVLSGVLRGSDQILNNMRAQGIDWWYVDNGYFGKPHRVSLNSTAPVKLIQGPPRYNHKISLMPWRGGHGRDIIILPPSEIYRGVFNIDNFLQSTVDQITKFTNKNIVVRPKYFDPARRPDWDRQLESAYCVVAWGSALCLDAMVKGVPTISLGNCPAAPVSFSFNDLGRKTLYTEPPRKELLNSLTWYNYDFEEFPKAYDILNEKLLGRSRDKNKIVLPPTITDLIGV